ncbi:MAG: DUF1800 family protein [Phenylobacterium sp.]
MAKDLDAAIAVTRFGLGARPGEIAEASRDPKGFLRAQIRRDGADPPQTDGETSAQRITAFRNYQQDKRDAKAEPDARDPVKMAQKMLREDTAADFLARIRLAATTEAGFRERWALFWANHFTVSATKLATATVVGPFETEAIRPRVFGPFADLLAAAEAHPAMLFYLDQAQSIGPNSPAALRGRGGVTPVALRRGGLNENLAREILELHTVGVDGGYSQADVTEFARAMTGVSIGAARDGDATGTPLFRAVAHEPGERMVMGVRYAPGGREQAGAILTDLAAKPATARFVCHKIARHFVADEPPPALTARLVAAWERSRGDLGRVAEALVTAPEAWSPQPMKFKTPYEFVVSAYRAAGAEPKTVGQVTPVLSSLGQKAFSAPSPKGWPEDTGSWAAPDAIVKRMQYAQGFSAAVTRDRDPKALATEALGARLTPATATAIARAESRAEGFALLLMSPEFQRR